MTVSHAWVSVKASPKTFFSRDESPNFFCPDMQRFHSFREVFISTRYCRTKSEKKVMPEDSQMKELRLSVVVAVCLITVLFLWVAETGWAQVPGQGTLTIVEPDGKPGAGCTLEHASVKAQISGFISRVYLIQTFSQS